MIYGYARVSSIGQAKDGNSLEDQCKALRERGCIEIYSEAYTGTTTDRPEFTKLLSKLEKGDTLMVTKLDRFSRSASEGAALVKELQKKGVVVDILNMGRADDSSMGKLMVTILLAFAEFEHDQILERLAAGKAVAKSHGKRTDGRKPVDVPDFREYWQRHIDGEYSVNECCEMLGICRSTWYKLSRQIKAA